MQRESGCDPGEGEHLGRRYLTPSQGGRHPRPDFICRLPIVTPKGGAVTAVHDWVQGDRLYCPGGFHRWGLPTIYIWRFGIPCSCCLLCSLPVKRYSVVIPDPIGSTESHRRIPEVCTRHLGNALVWGECFHPAGHALLMASGKETAKECKEYAAADCLGQVCRSLGHTEENTSQHGRHTRSWILFMPNHVNDTVLVFQ